MGHTRLGTLPKSKKWLEIVAIIASDQTTDSSGNHLLTADVGDIANRTLHASAAGLEKATGDPGLVYTFYLLTQITLASRKDNWQTLLADLGIELTEDGGLFDLTVGLQSAVDNYLHSIGRITDISEMAQQAAGEAVVTLAAPWSATLFGSGSRELQAAMKRLSTKKGFSDLGQLFFGRFLSRFLNFYLSRVTAGQVGGPRLHQVGDLLQFNESLQIHCEQIARIVHDFCGTWYSKTEYEEGISVENSKRFVAVALRKLKSELGQQEAES